MFTQEIEREIDKIIKEMGVREIWKRLLFLYDHNKDYRKAVNDMIMAIKDNQGRDS